MAVLYSIRNWNDLFETAQSRKIKGPLPWVAIPTKHDGLGFRRIVSMENGSAIYAAWILMVQVAAKCPVRGVLADENGPFDFHDLAAKTGFTPALFEQAITPLASNKIGWIVVERSQDDTIPEPFSNAQYSTGHNTTEQNKGASASPSQPLDLEGDSFPLSPPASDLPPDSPAPPAPPAKEPPAPAEPLYRAEDVPLPPELDTPDFHASRDAWFLQRRRKRLSLRKEYLVRQYERLRPLGPTNAAACLMHTVDQDYDGLFPDKFKSGGRGHGVAPKSLVELRRGR